MARASKVSLVVWSTMMSAAGFRTIFLQQLRAGCRYATPRTGLACRQGRAALTTIQRPDRAVITRAE